MTVSTLAAGIAIVAFAALMAINEDKPKEDNKEVFDNI